MDSVSSPVDDFVPTQINRLKFFTLNKFVALFHVTDMKWNYRETFPVVYKSLFITLNSTLQVLINTRNNMSTDELLSLW